jgi:hypothetical protein
MYILKIDENRRGARFIRILKWVFTKAHRIMSFGFYIRNCFLMCQFILICSVYEIFTNNGNGKYHVVSLVFAYLMVFLYVAFTSFTFYLALSPYSANEDGHSMLGEFFWGIKQVKRARLYMAIFLIRRALHILFFVGLTSISDQAVIGIITILQTGFVIYICVIRPFEEMIVNIIEILNEAVLLFLIFLLNMLYKSGGWNSGVTEFYMSIIVINFIVIFFAVLGKLSA